MKRKTFYIFGLFLFVLYAIAMAKIIYWPSEKIAVDHQVLSTGLFSGIVGILILFINRFVPQN
jgi:hypothetical protein